MGEQVLAAVRTGPRRTELREFPMPALPDDGALLRVEVAGICGTDVKMYAKPVIEQPVIMGHENVGTIVEAGQAFVDRQGLRAGDRVFVEHYVACYRCEWCRVGEYRHCELTDWRTNPDARRYGYTTCDNPFHLWGGFAEYMYLPWNAVLHKVPADRDGRTRRGSSRRSPTGSSGRSTTVASASCPPSSSRGRASRASPRSSPASRPARR